MHLFAKMFYSLSGYFFLEDDKSQCRREIDEIWWHFSCLEMCNIFSRLCFKFMLYLIFGNKFILMQWILGFLFFDIVLLYFWRGFAHKLRKLEIGIAPYSFERDKRFPYKPASLEVGWVIINMESKSGT